MKNVLVNLFNSDKAAVCLKRPAVKCPPHVQIDVFNRHPKSVQYGHRAPLDAMSLILRGHVSLVVTNHLQCLSTHLKRLQTARVGKK